MIEESLPSLGRKIFDFPVRKQQGNVHMIAESGTYGYCCCITLFFPRAKGTIYNERGPWAMGSRHDIAASCMY